MSRIAHLAAAVVVVASPASALPPSSGERRCVTAVDKGTAALAKTQGTLILDCLKRAAKGDLGGGSAPLTAGLLAPALPGFAALPPSTPLTLRLVPTLAPVLTGGGAASGEIVHLAAAVDARLDVAVAVDGTGLTFSLAAPRPADVTAAVLVNPLGTSEAAVAALVSTVLTGVLPDLAGALGTIPLSGVVGQSVEVPRSPYYTVFAEFGSLL